MSLTRRSQQMPKPLSRSAALAAAVCFGATAVVGASVLAGVPRHDRPVAVFAPPWSNGALALEIIARADSAMFASGRYPWVAVAYDNRPQLAQRLYAAGAVLVADAEFAAACTGLTLPAQQ